MTRLSSGPAQYGRSCKGWEKLENNQGWKWWHTYTFKHLREGQCKDDNPTQQAILQPWYLVKLTWTARAVNPDIRPSPATPVPTAHTAKNLPRIQAPTPYASPFTSL